jgi:polysaccharide export outer membrane protein
MTTLQRSHQEGGRAAGPALGPWRRPTAAAVASIALVAALVAATPASLDGQAGPLARDRAEQPAPTAATREPRAPAPMRAGARYRVRPGDTLDLDFRLTPEFNHTAIVQPDGYITLKGTAPIQVGGRTMSEVIDAVRRAYASVLRDPEVTVDLKDFERPFFIVGGEVGRPGKYDLRSDTTVAEAVAIAGGFTTGARHSQVWLFRRVANNFMESRKIDLKTMLKRGDLREDVHLQPDDLLYVPKSAFAKFERFIPVPGFGLFFNPNR